jgi:hypothetical protein
LDGIAERGQNVGIHADLERPGAVAVEVCGNRWHNDLISAAILARLAVLVMERAASVLMANPPAL